MNLHLIIGASGQVGEHLVEAVSAAGCSAVVGTYYCHPEPGLVRLDIRNAEEVRALFASIRPAVVYLPASLTNVDYCELHPEEGYATNVLGVRNLVQAVREIGATLVSFSSDYVFDGRAGPYREDDPANPICTYGVQKLIAEHYVALWAPDHLIVRTTVVYGWERHGKNFVYRMLNELKVGHRSKVPVDQIGNPTYGPNLAHAVVELVGSGARGIYHVVGPERVSRYEFACEAARTFGMDDGLILGVATSELGQPAARPRNAGMVAAKAAAVLSFPLLGYRDGLRAMASETR